MLFRAALLWTAIIAVPTSAQSVAAPTIEERQTPSAFQDIGTIDDQSLRAIAGRENLGLQIASANQRNTVSNNSVTGNSVTGSVAVDGNAFQNLQGLAVINANSGNNVAINSAMNVTINLAPMR